MTVVVDASVLVAVLVADARQEAARTALHGWLAAGEELHAPAVLPYEIANVLARRVFDGSIPRSDVTEIWQDVAALGIVLHPFDLTRDGTDDDVDARRLPGPQRGRCRTAGPARPLTRRPDIQSRWTSG